MNSQASSKFNTAFCPRSRRSIVSRRCSIVRFASIVIDIFALNTGDTSIANCVITVQRKAKNSLTLLCDNVLVVTANLSNVLRVAMRIKCWYIPRKGENHYLILAFSVC